MDRAHATPIDLVEAAYDLTSDGNGWLGGILEHSSALLESNLGCTGAILAGRTTTSEPLIARLRVESGPPDLLDRCIRAAREVWPQLEGHEALLREGSVLTVSGSRRNGTGLYDTVTKHVGCKDLLSIWAIDPTFHGVGINIPSDELIRFGPKRRRRCRMLSRHIATAYRLRRHLGNGNGIEGIPLSELASSAEAVVDPRKFQVVHGSECVLRNRSAAEALRVAARRADRARGRLRRDDPDGALEIWDAVCSGRWSMVDWFDTDGRRFILVMPHPPGHRDPRGLDEQECKVATLAAKGRASKCIGAELGLSAGRVSAILSSLMQKLGVRSHAQLVLMLQTMSS